MAREEDTGMATALSVSACRRCHNQTGTSTGQTELNFDIRSRDRTACQSRISPITSNHAPYNARERQSPFEGEDVLLQRTFTPKALPESVNVRTISYR
jgi:hypothetical protein